MSSVFRLRLSVRSLAVAAIMSVLLFWAGGCSSMSGEGESLEVRYALMRYKDANGDKDAARQVPVLARDLAKDRYASLSSRPWPETLPPLRAYIRDLRKPIEFDPAEAMRQAVKLSDGDKAKVIAWFAGKQVTLSGSELLPEWKAQIAKAEELDSRLEGQKRAALDSARASLETNRYAEADRLVKEAIRLDPDDASVASDYAELQRHWVDYAFSQLRSAMTSTTIPKLKAQTDSFHRPGGSTEASVKKLVADLDAARKELVAFSDWAASRSEFAAAMKPHAEAFTSLLDQCGAIRGTAWRESLWLSVQAHDYWDYYLKARELAATRADGNGSAYTDSEATVLRKGLQDGYTESLAEAANYYGAQATKCKTQKLNGLALTNWRIACEMLDFGRQIGCALPQRAVDIGQTLDASMKPVRESMRAGFARTIVIPNFDDRQNMDGDDVARKLLTAMQMTFSDASVPATAIGVKVRMKDDSPEVADGDYLLSGKVSGLFVDTLPVEETERKEVQVGREPVVSPNDDPRTKDDFPNKYTQEVWVYTRSTRKHTMKCEVAADFVTERHGEKMPLWSVSQVFGAGKPLPEAKLEDQAVDWSFILVRRQESPRKTDMLTASDLPKSTSASLPSERDVRERAIDYICAGISDQLVPVVEAYPFTDLLGRATTAASSGQAVDAADYAGQCLEYLCLVSGTGGVTGQPGNDWIRQRSAMEQTVNQKLIPQWRDHKVAVPDAVGTAIWPKAVELAAKGAVK